MFNPSHANWVNQLQPLFIAGTVFVSSGTPSGRKGSHLDNAWEFQNQLTPPPAHGSNETLRTIIHAPEGEGLYAEERMLLLNHLARIERETGWKTSDCAATLRTLWGLE
ncbi:hypothetical protein ASPCADRAFT_131522 [Aspergillus carbonarius ITEM 5010]|uniref:Uncharacterized protein n=1 Tax=Aspergillus carbonarius (strain ITEM 5010) TaxID=602072 RepID=A0A1R3RKD8_ASPC5|nr:hypothetical protein ASPCADRAFT_131522 [Aspergillus carbonarius ITEM 5010]